MDIGRMRARTNACLAFTAMVIGCMPSTPGESPQSQAGAAAPTLDPFLQRMFADLNLVPGVAVAVVRDTSIVYLRGFGVANVSSGQPVTPRTPFYIASSTKAFVGTAAAILDLKGVWDLDDPLSRWIPDARIPAPLSASTVTLRELLTHTSRIDNDPITFRTAYSGEHDRSVLTGLLQTSAVRPPGFSYGNIGYVVASLAMDAAARTDWQDVLRREVFEPLGMRRTSARRSAFDDADLAFPHGPAAGGGTEVRRYIKTDRNMHAAGGMITTAEDLARWLLANLNDGRLAGRQPLPAAAVREAHRPQATTDAKFYQFTRKGYGLGWYQGEYEGDVLLHDFGNYPGFRAHVSFMPAHKIGVAVLANESTLGYYMPEVMATYIYDRLLGKPGLEQKYDSAMSFLRNDAMRVRSSIERDRLQRAARPTRLQRPAAYYTGTYVSRETGTMRILQTPDHALEVRIGTLTSLAEPIDDAGTLLRVELVPGSGVQLKFYSSDGQADSLTFSGRIFRRID